MKMQNAGMDVGKQYIVFGANTGSLYFFNRGALRFLQLISSPDIHSAVTHIRFSPDERFVGLSTLDGELIVLEPNLGTRAKERIVLRHHLHRDSVASTPTSASAATPAASGSAPAPSTTAAAGESGITCITWAPRAQEDENYLFSSDTTGAIIITPVITSLIKRSFMLNSSGPESLYKADSRVVQLDCSDNSAVVSASSGQWKIQLLISTLTKSILLTIDTNAKQITGLQVGSKPRKGNYGACFSTSSAAVSSGVRSFCWQQRPIMGVSLNVQLVGGTDTTLHDSLRCSSRPSYMVPLVILTVHWRLC